MDQNYISKAARIIFWAFFIWLFTRIFLFQTAHVPTSSMRNTYLEGDRIIVNKIIYGARIPITPLSLPFGDVYLDWIHLPYLRLPGFSSVKHNDVIVFNYPMDDDLPIDERKPYVKRCIGLPGDTIRIKKGIVFINSKATGEPESVLYTYIVKRIPSRSYEKENDGFLKNYNGYTENKYSNTNYLDLTIKNADTISKNQNVSSISRALIDSAAYSPSVFPNSSTIKWNADNFGPLYIPKKGESISLTKLNVTLYKRVIEKYEGNSLNVLNDSVFINGKCSSSYTFKMNYYFAMGDNRYHSIDSRFWGFVPEDHLIGKGY